MTPTLTNVINHTPNSVTVYWSPVDVAPEDGKLTGYNGRYKKSSDPEFTHFFQVFRQNRRLFSLVAGTQYDIQFSIEIDEVDQEWSETFNFTTLS